MKITNEVRLYDFEFWGPAVDHATKLTMKEADQLEAIIEEMRPDGIDAVVLNDMFAYEFETICDWLGLTEEEVLERED